MALSEPGDILGSATLIRSTVRHGYRWSPREDEIKRRYLATGPRQILWAVQGRQGSHSAQPCLAGDNMAMSPSPVKLHVGFLFVSDGVEATMFPRSGCARKSRCLATGRRLEASWPDDGQTGSAKRPVFSRGGHHLGRKKRRRFACVVDQLGSSEASQVKLKGVKR